MIIEKIEIDGKTITVHTSLPAPDAGYTKGQILEAFVKELNATTRLADTCLTGTLRINGRMTTEMALAAGAIAARLGAKSVELYDTGTGSYNPVLGEGAPLAMPVPMLPGMIVEVTGDGLFRRGAEAVIINVGEDSVNIADPDRGVRGRRDTGWTARDKVRPVRWATTPSLRR